MMSLSSLRRTLKQYDFKICQKHQNVDYFIYSSAGAALFFLDMAKDVVDTFKPYKTKYHRNRDLLQFFYGLKNTIYSLVSIPAICADLIFSALVFIAAPITALINYNEESFIDYLAEEYLYALGIIIYSLTNILGATAQAIRGVTQIVTAPLTLTRVLLRTMLSIGRVEEKFQDRKSIKRLVGEADHILSKDGSKRVSEMKPILDELYRKSVTQTVKKYEVYEDKNIPIKVKDKRFKSVDYNSSYFFGKEQKCISAPVKEEIRIRLAQFRPG